jgi:hypothetical protein
MDQDRKDDRSPAPRSNVPKPPSREEVEKISDAQQYITDDWTGDGGKGAEKANKEP